MSRTHLRTHIKTQTLDHVVVVRILIWDKRKSQINEYSDPTGLHVHIRFWVCSLLEWGIFCRNTLTRFVDFPQVFKFDWWFNLFSQAHPVHLSLVAVLPVHCMDRNRARSHFPRHKFWSSYEYRTHGLNDLNWRFFELFNGRIDSCRLCWLVH